MSLDELLNIARTRRPEAREIEAHCRARDESVSSTLDADARAVAVRYAAGEIDFNTGDSIMNAFFAYAVTQAEREGGIPQDMFEVFRAFDAGEFYPDAIREPNPEERFTKPLVNAFLMRVGQDGGSPEERQP